MTTARGLPFPDSSVLAALALMHLGEQAKGTFCYHSAFDHYAVTFPDGRSYTVTYAAFDACCERQWITADGEDVRLTDSGKWQAAKWLKRNRLEAESR